MIESRYILVNPAGSDDTDTVARMCLDPQGVWFKPILDEDGEFLIELSELQELVQRAEEDIGLKLEEDHDV